MARRDYAAEYAARTLLPKLVEEAKRSGASSPKAIEASVREALAFADASRIAGGAKTITATQRRLRRLGKEASKLTTSSARGHAKRAELSTSILRKRAAGASAKSIRSATTTMKSRRVVKAVKKGKSLTSSLKSAGISKKAFRKTKESAAVVRLRRRGRYQFSPNYGSALSIITISGRMLKEHFLPPDWNVVMDWRYAAYDAIAYNRPLTLEKMAGVTVRDARGRRYELETDPAAIKALLEAADQSEEEFFQSQGDGRGVRGRAANSNRGITRRAA